MSPCCSNLTQPRPSPPLCSQKQRISGLSTTKAHFHAGEGLASDESFLWIDHHTAAAAAATTTTHGCDKDWATAELNDRQ
eukprot:COSAG06_NODE_26014_length_623_cov_2.599237_2_plen_79_part_01